MRCGSYYRQRIALARPIDRHAVRRMRLPLTEFRSRQVTNHKCVFLSLSIAALSLASSAFAETTYTNLSLKGAYALAETALPTSGGAVAAIGMLTADGNGGVTGTAYLRASRFSSSAANVTGQYVINQNGTGSMVLSFAAPDATDSDVPLARQYDLVFTRRGLTGASTDGGVFSTIDLEQPATAPAQGYSMSSLAGSYGITETGAYNGLAARISVGEMKLDGTGGVTGTIEERIAGRATLSYDFTGTYTVNSAGAGTVTMQRSSVTDDGTTTVTSSSFAFVVGKDQKLVALRLDSGAASTALFERQ